MIESFAPIVDDSCKILILGTAPSIKSLEKTEYYGHPQNHFWKIIYGLFGKEPDAEFEKKKAFLLEHHIALWDVVKCCEREGSSDSNIKKPIPNEIAQLLHEHPDIKAVFFNSAKAEELFNRYVRKNLKRHDLFFYRLISSSPLRMLPLEAKIENWRIILKYL